MRFKEPVDRRNVTSRDGDDDELAEDASKRWFNDEDYLLFLQNNRLASMDTQAHGFAKLLPERFEASKNTETQEALNKWCHSCHSRRGLERWCNTKHGAVRKQQQKHAIRSVLLVQNACDGENTEQLAQVSARFTNNAKQFAAMMGNADAHAQKNETEETSAALRKFSSTTCNDAHQDAADEETQQKAGNSKKIASKMVGDKLFPKAA